MTPTTLFCSHTCEKYYSPVHNHPTNEVLNELHMETAWPFLSWWSLSRGHSTYRWTVVCLHISYLQVFKKEQYKFKYLKINLQLMKKNLIIFAAAKSTSHFHHTNAVFLENGQYKEMHYIFENTSCSACFRQKWNQFNVRKTVTDYGCQQLQPDHNLMHSNRCLVFFMAFHKIS